MSWIHTATVFFCSVHHFSLQLETFSITIFVVSFAMNKKRCTSCRFAHFEFRAWPLTRVICSDQSAVPPFDFRKFHMSHEPNFPNHSINYALCIWQTTLVGCYHLLFFIQCEILFWLCLFEIGYFIPCAQHRIAHTVFHTSEIQSTKNCATLKYGLAMPKQNKKVTLPI